MNNESDITGTDMKLNRRDDVITDSVTRLIPHLWRGEVTSVEELMSRYDGEYSEIVSDTIAHVVEDVAVYGGLRIHHITHDLGSGEYSLIGHNGVRWKPERALKLSVGKCSGYLIAVDGRLIPVSSGRASSDQSSEGTVEPILWARLPNPNLTLPDGYMGYS